MNEDLLRIKDSVEKAVILKKHGILIEQLNKRVDNNKGEKGDKGDKGFPGRDGFNGKDGKNGIDGKDGINGKDGVKGDKGDNGLDGLSGKDGDNGKDGSPDTPSEIKDKLETLKGEKRLDSSAIKGLTQFIEGSRKIFTSKDADKLYLKLNGSNADSDIDIGTYDFTTLGNITGGNLSGTNTGDITFSGLTGFTLTGQQISYTANYSLPLTADTAKGVTAYSWGDHASGGYVKTDQTVGQTIGATGARLTKLWATNIEISNLPTIGGATLASALGLGTAAYTAATAYEASGAIATHAALLTGVHGLAITAGKTLTVQDNVTITGALGTGAYATIANYALVGQTFYIGTTQVAINRASAGLTLAGITLTTPDIGAATGTSLALTGADLLLSLNTSSATGNPYLQFQQDGTRRGWIQYVDAEDRIDVCSEYGNVCFWTGVAGTETKRMEVFNTGLVGINTGSNTPDGYLTIHNTQATTINLRLAKYYDNAYAAEVRMFKSRGTIATPKAVASGDYLGEFIFQADSGTGTAINSGDFACVCEAAPTSGTRVPSRLEFWNTNSGASFAEKMRLTGWGNLKIGTSTQSGNSRGTTEGTQQIVLFDGTAPVGTLTNGISIYSAAGECWIMDAGGTATQQTSHDRITKEWVLNSINTGEKTGSRIFIEKLAKFIDDKFGTDFYEEYEADLESMCNKAELSTKRVEKVKEKEVTRDL